MNFALLLSFIGNIAITLSGEPPSNLNLVLHNSSSGSIFPSETHLHHSSLHEKIVSEPVKMVNTASGVSSKNVSNTPSKNRVINTSKNVTAAVEKNSSMIIKNHSSEIGTNLTMIAKNVSSEVHPYIKGQIHNASVGRLPQEGGGLSVVNLHPLKSSSTREGGKITARKGVKFEEIPSTPKPKPKFTVVQGEKPSHDSPSFIESPITGKDYVLPLVLVILAAPLAFLTVRMIYRRGSEYTERRYYDRMYLIDGMYNTR